VTALFVRSLEGIMAVCLDLAEGSHGLFDVATAS